MTRLVTLVELRGLEPLKKDSKTLVELRKDTRVTTRNYESSPAETPKGVDVINTAPANTAAPDLLAELWALAAAWGRHAARSHHYAASYRYRGDHLMAATFSGIGSARRSDAEELREILSRCKHPSAETEVIR
jgi:hypothetical protein